MSKSPPTKPDAMSLHHFAYRVAGPREILIAGSINAGIAWLLFGRLPQVALVGGHSLMSMVVPLSVLLPGLTSFFGVLAGALSRKANAVAPPLPPETVWMPMAIRLGFQRGIAGGCLAGLATLLMVWWDVDTELSGWASVAIITLLSSLLAYGLHSSAIMATLRLDAKNQVPRQ